LVLAVTASRMGEAGKETVERWKEWARDGRWRDIYVDGVPTTYTGYRRHFYAPMLRLFGGAVFDEPANVNDVVVSCDACLNHDATDALDEIDVPTLVIGGAEDHFFPEPIVRETAAGIENSRLKLFERAGHGVFEERKHQFDAAVRGFLDGRGESSREKY
jgi:pimeloyl-ACP methyl ester carboxylesterase